eukprot:212952-Amorphochlora_amoeboformis.AAC.1
MHKQESQASLIQTGIRLEQQNLQDTEAIRPLINPGIEAFLTLFELDQRSPQEQKPIQTQEKGALWSSGRLAKSIWWTG